MARPINVLGFLGSTVDAGFGPGRWQRWRPTISLVDRDDVDIARLDLLVIPGHNRVSETVVADIAALSPTTQVVLHPFVVKDAWDFEEVYAALHDFVHAYPFRADDETYWVHLTTGTHVMQICWFLLVEAGFIPGQLMQTSPPRQGQPSPLGIFDLDLAKYDRIASRFADRQRQAVGLLKSGIATRNVAFNRLIDRIEQVAIASTAPMLIMGPTGAGKSQLARRIAELKRDRRQVAGPFVEVNCATLRGDGAMSALFGHTRGAFTGAAGDRKGLLLSAHGGVLFLDEIGELGLDEQAMLLRAVEEKVFFPMGSDQEVRSSFQLIAGTNRPLQAEVRAGRFREDLLARIDLWTFALPGLAQRPEDIEPNLDYELEQFAARTGRNVRLNKEARERFLRFAATAPWPANFRDLNAAVTRMATLAAGGRIDLALVGEECERLAASWAGPTAVTASARLLGKAADDLDRFDRVQLDDVLAVCARSRSLSEAGRELFAVSLAKRAAPNDADRLRKYLLRFDLTWEDVRS